MTIVNRFWFRRKALGLGCGGVLGFSSEIDDIFCPISFALETLKVAPLQLLANL